MQLEKGKCLGQIDMGYSVISMQAERLRLDIDAGDQTFVYHLKVYNKTYRNVCYQCSDVNVQVSHIRTVSMLSLPYTK